MKKAVLRVPAKLVTAGSSGPIWERFFSTKSASCRSMPKFVFYACCKMATSNELAGRNRFVSMFASWRRPTATSRRWSAKARSARILWYRIAVFPILLPPLRDRVGDIPSLAKHFAQRAAIRFGLAPVVPTDADIELLQGYDWPGNIRELGPSSTGQRFWAMAVRSNWRRRWVFLAPSFELNAAIDWTWHRTATPPSSIDCNPQRGDEDPYRIGIASRTRTNRGAAWRGQTFGDQSSHAACAHAEAENRLVGVS